MRKGELSIWQLVLMFLMLLVILGSVIMIIKFDLFGYIKLLPVFGGDDVKRPVLIDDLPEDIVPEENLQPSIPDEIISYSNEKKCGITAYTEDDYYHEVLSYNSQYKTPYYIKEGNKIKRKDIGLFGVDRLDGDNEVGSLETVDDASRVFIYSNYLEDVEPKDFLYKLDGSVIVPGQVSGKETFYCGVLDENGCPEGCYQEQAQVSCEVRGDGKGECNLGFDVLTFLENKELSSYVCSLGCGVSSVCEGTHSKNSRHYKGQAVDIGCGQDVDKMNLIKTKIKELYSSITIPSPDSKCKFDCNGNEPCCEIHGDSDSTPCGNQHVHCQFQATANLVNLRAAIVNYEDISSDDISSVMKFVKENKGISDGNVKRGCDYDINNPIIYAQLIEKYSKKINAPSLMVLALMIQEGGCNQEAVNNNEDGSEDVGLMQVNSNTFNVLCKDKTILGVSIGSIDDIKGSGEGKSEKNIACGMAILQEKYKTVGDSGKEQIYENSVKNNCKDVANQELYLTYSGWLAALRYYNGLDCPDTKADYVEKISNIHNNLYDEIKRMKEIA